jgi:hypothetical protein
MISAISKGARLCLRHSRHAKGWPLFAPVRAKVRDQVSARLNPDVLEVVHCVAEVERRSISTSSVIGQKPDPN